MKAPYLNDHPAVIDTFIERIDQILSGDISMNCQLCKYRTQVLGFEADVGAVQESHHHHVEGIGTSDDCAFCHGGPCTNACKGATTSGPFELASRPHTHGHSHDHGHGHDHGHTHAPYPHADHPLGPRTLKK